MFSNIALAYTFLYLCAGLIVAGIIILFSMKMSHNSALRKKEQYAKKHQDYFVYVQANLTGSEKLRLPQGKLVKLEKEVILDKCIAWISQLKGEHADKLRDLTREAGFVDEQIKLLGSFWTGKAMQAAYRLGGMRSEEAAEPILELLKEEKKMNYAIIYARAAAKCAERPAQLKEMLGHLLSKGKPVHRLAADILMETSLEPSKLLNEMLESEDQDFIKVGIIAMWGQAIPEVMPAVTRLFNSKEQEIRSEAIKLYLSTSPVLKDRTIVEWMGDPAEEVRAAVAKKLGASQQISSIPLLQNALSDEDWLVRHNSAASLAALGEKGFEALCETALTAKGIAKETALEYAEQAMEDTSEYEEIEKMMTFNKKRLIYNRYFGMTPKANSGNRVSGVIGGGFTA
ncbi:HEAT repeat domain-containing protein [Neobacillus mesonae]|nr:HEAT repeat domain-containing protein [Neobacillus mesonae]